MKVSPSRVSTVTIHCLVYLLALLATSCGNNSTKSSNYHDGVFIPNKTILLMAKAAWVINGDKFYTHTSGGAQLLSCDQFRDRIEISDGRVFYFEMNSNGQEEVIIESDVLNIKMVKVSNDPDMSHEDIVEMLATAYEK